MTGLYQLRQQSKKFPYKLVNDFMSQHECNSRASMMKWIAETQTKYPLPDGACWLICNEKSEHFLLAVAEVEA